MKLCKRGHDMDEVGRAANRQCRVCRRELDARWHANRYDELTGVEYARWLLYKRRRKALTRRAERALRHQED